MKQLHSYDYSGPYAGFIGAVNFYREIGQNGEHKNFQPGKGAVAG
jgi:nitrogenase molybdenum-iron protein alpha/beta subunit